MGECIPAIAKALEEDSDVERVFKDVQIYEQRLSPSKMTEMIRKLVGYQFGD